MRRSSIVQLTILPMLATAALAAADPVDPYAEELSPPGMTEPSLAPPGMTPTADECDVDPDQLRCDPMYFVEDDCEGDDCNAVAIVPGGGVIYGGFGNYFWVSHS